MGCDVTVTERLADCLIEISETSLSEALQDKLARHLFDTLGALLAGLPLHETRALADAARNLSGPSPSLTRSGLSGPLGPTILRLCTAVRCTEVDDIHLASCITPSAIIVPSALATAVHLPDATGEHVMTACLAGYEAIIRLGLAIDGPGVLYKGIWPTYLCASLGSAATVGVLLRLTQAQFAHALAIAAAMASGANARSDSPSGKWLLAGTAAQNGALAAFAARRGLQGDLGLLGERWGKLFGISLDAAVLTEAMSDRRHAETLAMKPWCGARQAMSALAAFTALLERQAFAPDSVSGITVEVPKTYLQMIDRPGLPASRQESFAHLRYLFGLAAYAPDGLCDVARIDLHSDPRFAALAGKIGILHGADLDAHYPRHWPARVSVIDQAGTQHVETVILTPGDPEAPLDWRTLAAKFERVSGRGAETAAQIAAACRSLTSTTDLRGLLTLVSQEIRDAEIPAN
jgi:2-methylcitrate dehydratase PrpD